jgi:hypothetical protein
MCEALCLVPLTVSLALCLAFLATSNILSFAFFAASTAPCSRSDVFSLALPAASETCSSRSPSLRRCLERLLLGALQGLPPLLRTYSDYDTVNVGLLPNGISILGFSTRSL